MIMIWFSLFLFGGLETVLSVSDRKIGAGIEKNKKFEGLYVETNKLP